MFFVSFLFYLLLMRQINGIFNKILIMQPRPNLYSSVYGVVSLSCIYIYCIYCSYRKVVFVHERHYNNNNVNLFNVT